MIETARLDAVSVTRPAIRYHGAKFRLAIDEIKRLRSCCQRYETARRMNPQQWAEAWQLNITTGKPLDEIIDVRRSQLPKTGE